jgi:tRNA A-37 threonylcarbamoyl transferase component Bud32
MDGGRVFVESAYLPWLEAEGLVTFEAVMDFERGNLRHLDERSNYCFSTVGDRGAKEFFLKKHAPASGTGPAPGLAEWENVARLRAAGVPTFERAAAGFDPTTGRSFFMSERIEGGEPLDDYMIRVFAGPLNRAGVSRKRHLIRNVAKLAARFHGAGFCHHDLYLCHILVSETGAGLKLYVIDLQRVETPRLFRRRLIAKDTAALLYSSRRVPATRTDRMRFVTAYLGRSIDAAAKRFIRKVMRKARRIARHNRPRDLERRRETRAR